MDINITLANEFELEDVDKALIYISFLHYNNVINDEKLSGMFKQLRPNGGGFMAYSPLLRRVNTHFDKITKKWFYDDYYINILKEIVSMVYIRKTEMPMETFLNYLNRYLNKNKNYCVDYVYFAIIKKLISRYSLYFIDYEGKRYYSLDTFNTSFNFRLKAVDFEYFQPSGYCCEDCDGDWEEYKKNHYKYQFGHLESELENIFMSELAKYKTKGYTKNKDRRFYIY